MFSETDVAQVAVLPVIELSGALPGLSFSVEAHHGGSAAQGEDRVHPFSGAGKLIFGTVLAELSVEDPSLLAAGVSLLDKHRGQARTGTLRLLSGDMSLSVDDAANLVLSTGDAAAALALLEFLDRRGVDLRQAAQELLTRLMLTSTQVTGLEGPQGSAGEGFLGTTTPQDLLRLLACLCASMEGEERRSVMIAPEASRSVLRWMRGVFEPGGLASALPGHGPHRVPHWTVSGWESLSQGEDQGCASVLITHSSTAGWVCAAAFHPAWRTLSSVSSPRDVSAAFGTLGLSAYLNEQA